MTDNRLAVLVVDDVEANLVAMEALLADIDCDVVRASSGNDALRLLLKRDFAAILLDVQMPEMDGYEVARLARMDPRSKDIPIIFVTATSETEENVFRGYDSGAVDVLYKPVNRHVLRSKVKVFLELERSRRKLAEEVEAHKRTLAELEAFNHSVSHDLRAPLRPIHRYATMLLEEHGAKLDDDGRRLLARIRSAAERMDRIIDDLLRLSQVSRARPAPRPLDLGELASEVVADIRADDPGRRVEVVIAPNMKTRGDAHLLRVALDNLLRNAWKFTSKTPEPRIEVGSTVNGQETVFFVADNGVGFEQAHAERLFRAFQRLHSANEFDGTGIGLAIVKRVIDHHGGRIWVEAEPQRGARFSFTLA